MKRMQFALGAAILLAAAVQAPRAQQRGEGWPQYLGPHRNNVAMAAIPPTARLAVAWRTPLGSGSAGLVVTADRAYTLASEDDRDYLFALNAADGREVWRAPLGPTHRDAANGPAATPAVDGEVIVALGSSCTLAAVRVSGDIVWQKSLAELYKSRFAEGGGCRMSPLVVDGRVILPTGAREGAKLVAFDVASGQEAWRTTDLPNGPNMAVGLTEQGGERLVLYQHVKQPGVAGVTAVHARTGAVAWQIDGERGMSDTTPVPVAGNRILMQTWAGSTVLEGGGAAPRALWTNDELSALGPPPVAHGGHVFGFGGNSGEFLKCVDAATGQARWSSRIYRGYAARAGETIVVLSESSGLVRLVAADPAAYRELSRVQALTPGARTITPPAVANGRIFVRNLEEVVALDAR